jgi:ATP-dependent DNA helicase DinG
VRDVPTVPGPAGLTDAVDAAFSAEGALARAVDGYEPRDGQRRMAQAVGDVLDEGGTLLAQAGTGTGKTLAYLIPAILSRHRVLVSTGTKNLQEQIFLKDLPAVRDALGVPFTATLMKGRGNYLCLHRWQIVQQSESPEHAMFLPVINDWAQTTTTGDRAELRDVPEDLPMWKEIAAEAESCLGNQCPRYGDCFITLMRQRAAESDVVIVNHHLLCADAAVRRSEYGEVIPSCPTLVVDEAHQLEDVATQYFGVGFSNFRVDDLVRDGERLLGSRSFGDREQDVHRALTRVSDRARTFFSAIVLARGSATQQSEARARYTAEAMADHFENGMMLVGALEGLEATLALLSGPQGPQTDGASGSGPYENTPGTRGQVAELSGPEAQALESLQRRAGEARTDLRFLMRADDQDFVYYLEARGRAVFLRASPVDVSRLLPEAIFDRFRTIVLTSATLTVDNSFEYVKARLGVKTADEIGVASEFDFSRQALLYLPRRMPPPKAPNFAEAAAREAIELLKRSRGRAFVLFTSYAVLRTVQQFVEMALSYPVFVQGEAPRSLLIEQFRTTPNAILLGTSSFWQGVDVVGDALSCVIIDKLPFASPSDPVTAARIDAITAAGGDAFGSYQVPLAILNLQQGLGRLIRHRTDRGVLAILDPRLKTMGYGRRFLASLPPAPVTHDLDAVERFFG